MSRYVTEDVNPAERFALYRLCECAACSGRGKLTVWGEIGAEIAGIDGPHGRNFRRCPECRGEGRTRDLVATCATPEALGVALVTLGREHELDDCPIGVLDRMGEKGEKWIVKPWLPSARNVSDAGRTLAQAKSGRKT